MRRNINRLRLAFNNYMQETGIFPGFKKNLDTGAQFLQKNGIPMEWIFPIIDAFDQQTGKGVERGMEFGRNTISNTSIYPDNLNDEYVKIGRTRGEKFNRKAKKGDYSKNVTSINKKPVLPDKHVIPEYKKNLPDYGKRTARFKHLEKGHTKIPEEMQLVNRIVPAEVKYMRKIHRT